MANRFSFNDKALDFNDLGKKNLDGKIKEFDKLGLKFFASALAEFINECETPMTIGIQGDWGIGKTSTLNMIKVFLEGKIFKKEKAGYRNGLIWFNTWQYSLFHQDEFHGASVIKALLDSIKKEFNVSDDKLQNSKEAINRVLKTLGSISFGGFSIDPTKMLEGKESQADKLGYVDISSIMLDFKVYFEQLVQTIVEQNKLSRLVIFIDDLDRVKPIKALELLESIKNFMDVPNCVFVVAVDYEVVQIGMANKLGEDLQKTSGKSFFDKIIQLPFTMPTTSYKLDDYVKSLLEEAQFTGTRKITDDERRYYSEITACTVGRNPRSIKRVINYAKLLDIVRRENSPKGKTVTINDREILYSLICMQIAWPEIFSFFVKNPYAETILKIEDWDFIDTIPHIQKLYDRTIDTEQLKSDISSFFDLLFEIVDKNGDGNISKEEFVPIWEMLKMTKLTSISSHEQPFDTLLRKVKHNDKENDYSKFLDLLSQSKWKLGKEITYKISGSRYTTIVVSRKQVGSIVSLQSSPLIFRLAKSSEKIKEDFSKKLSDGLIIDEIFTPITNKALTGFGETQFHVDKIEPLSDQKGIDLLDHLYDLIDN